MLLYKCFANDQFSSCIGVLFSSHKTETNNNDCFAIVPGFQSTVKKTSFLIRSTRQWNMLSVADRLEPSSIMFKNLVAIWTGY